MMLFIKTDVSQRTHTNLCSLLGLVWLLWYYFMFLLFPLYSLLCELFQKLYSSYILCSVFEDMYPILRMLTFKVVKFSSLNIPVFLNVSEVLYSNCYVIFNITYFKCLHFYFCIENMFTLFHFHIPPHSTLILLLFL